MNFIAVRCVGHIIHFIFPFRPVVCLLVNGIAFHTETNAFMNNNAEPRSFPFPFREVWRLHGAFQRALSLKSNVIRLYLMYYLLDYFAVALVTYASKLLSCNSTGLSLHAVGGQQRAGAVCPDWCTHLSSSAFPACYHLTYSRAATLPSQRLMDWPWSSDAAWKALFSLI